MNHMCSLRRLLDGFVDEKTIIEFPDLDITGLSLDSRKISKKMLFVALQGTRSHGLDFAAQAIKQGASAIIWEYSNAIDLATWDLLDVDIPVIAVTDLSDKLGGIADRYYGSPSQSLTMIGITGTDGKTSVSHLLAQAINSKEPAACSVIGTMGIGLPDNLQKATHTTPDVISVHGILRQQKNADVKTVAMEVSSHALDQNRVNAVQFDTAVLTNLTRDHLDYHGTVEAYAAAKEKLFHWDGLKHIVVNLDDAMGLRLATELVNTGVRVVGFSIDENTCVPDGIELLFASKAVFDHRGIVADIMTPIGECSLIAPILGKFNLSNLLTVLGVLIVSGNKLDEAVTQIEKVLTVPGRMERISSQIAGDSTLVVVDYAHTPGAMEQALLAVRQHSEKRVICVFGCGGDRDTGKRPLMAAVAERLADQVIVTDDNPRSEDVDIIFEDIKQGFENVKAVTFQHDRRKAIALAINETRSGDVILIAGKGHETVQIIKDKKLPFDDRIEATLLLEQRFKGKAA